MPRRRPNLPGHGWDESEHPRNPRDSPGGTGGEFRNTHGGVSGLAEDLAGGLRSATTGPWHQRASDQIAGNHPRERYNAQIIAAGQAQHAENQADGFDDPELARLTTSAAASLTSPEKKDARVDRLRQHLESRYPQHHGMGLPAPVEPRSGGNTRDPGQDATNRRILADARDAQQRIKAATGEPDDHLQILIDRAQRYQTASGGMHRVEQDRTAGELRDYMANEMDQAAAADDLAARREQHRPPWVGEEDPNARGRDRRDRHRVDWAAQLEQSIADAESVVPGGVSGLPPIRLTDTAAQVGGFVNVIQSSPPGTFEVETNQPGVYARVMSVHQEHGSYWFTDEQGHQIARDFHQVIRYREHQRGDVTGGIPMSGTFDRPIQMSGTLPGADTGDERLYGHSLSETALNVMRYRTEDGVDSTVLGREIERMDQALSMGDPQLIRAQADQLYGMLLSSGDLQYLDSGDQLPPPPWHSPSARDQLNNRILEVARAMVGDPVPLDPAGIPAIEAGIREVVRLAEQQQTRPDRDAQTFQPQIDRASNRLRDLIARSRPDIAASLDDPAATQAYLDHMDRVSGDTGGTPPGNWTEVLPGFNGNAIRNTLEAGMPILVRDHGDGRMHEVVRYEPIDRDTARLHFNNGMYMTIDPGAETLDIQMPTYGPDRRSAARGDQLDMMEDRDLHDLLAEYDSERDAILQGYTPGQAGYRERAIAVLRAGDIANPQQQEVRARTARYEYNREVLRQAMTYSDWYRHGGGQDEQPDGFSEFQALLQEAEHMNTIGQRDEAYNRTIDELSQSMVDADLEFGSAQIFGQHTPTPMWDATHNRAVTATGGVAIAQPPTLPTQEFYGNDWARDIGARVQRGETIDLAVGANWTRVHSVSVDNGVWTFQTDLGPIPLEHNYSSGYRMIAGGPAPGGSDLVHRGTYTEMVQAMSEQDDQHRLVMWDQNSGHWMQVVGIEPGMGLVFAVTDGHGGNARIATARDAAAEWRFIGPNETIPPVAAYAATSTPTSYQNAAQVAEAIQNGEQIQIYLPAHNMGAPAGWHNVIGYVRASTGPGSVIQFETSDGHVPEFPASEQIGFRRAGATGRARPQTPPVARIGQLSMEGMDDRVATAAEIQAIGHGNLQRYGGIWVRDPSHNNQWVHVTGAGQGMGPDGDQIHFAVEGHRHLNDLYFTPDQQVEFRYGDDLETRPPIDTQNSSMGYEQASRNALSDHIEELTRQPGGLWLQGVAGPNDWVQVFGVGIDGDFREFLDGNGNIVEQGPSGRNIPYSIGGPPAPVDDSVLPFGATTLAEALADGGGVPDRNGRAAVQRLLREMWTFDDPHSGLRTQVTSASWHGGMHASVEGKVYDQTGQEVGTFTRELAGTKVNHAYFKLLGVSQGGGLSTRWLEEMKRRYREQGLKRITIYANIDVGGYAWAKAGFDFTNDYEGKGHVEQLWYDVEAGRYSVGPETKAEVEALLTRARAGERITPLEIAMLGWRQRGSDHFEGYPREVANGDQIEMWLGKRYMLGKNWNGEFVL